MSPVDPIDLSNRVCGPLNEGNQMRMKSQNSNSGRPNTPTRAEGTVEDIYIYIYIYKKKEAISTIPHSYPLMGVVM